MRKTRLHIGFDRNRIGLLGLPGTNRRDHACGYCRLESVTVSPSTLLDFAATAATIGVTMLTAALGFAAGRERAARSLGLFFLCLTVTSIGDSVILGWGEWLTPTALRWARVINVPGAYLLGPLLYGYVIALLPIHAANPVLRSWHIVPFVLTMLLALANALWPFAPSSAGFLLVGFAHDVWVLQGVPYLAAAAWHLRTARIALEQVSADETALRLAWLRRLVAVIAAIWTIAGIERVLPVCGLQERPWLATLLSCGMVVSLYFLAWFGLRQRILVPAAFIESFNAAPGDIANARYQRSALDASALLQIANDLTRLLRDQRLYTDSQLDLQALSHHSGWSPSYISQALNQQLGRNFFEFVNGFRIQAAEVCLADPADRRTILDIAMACGFGSKSTFNHVFKRMTGATPSEFRRRYAAATCEPAGSDG